MRLRIREIEQGTDRENLNFRALWPSLHHPLHVGQEDEHKNSQPNGVWHPWEVRGVYATMWPLPELRACLSWTWCDLVRYGNPMASKPTKKRSLLHYTFFWTLMGFTGDIPSCCSLLILRLKSSLFLSPFEDEGTPTAKVDDNPCLRATPTSESVLSTYLGLFLSDVAKQTPTPTPRSEGVALSQGPCQTLSHPPFTSPGTHMPCGRLEGGMLPFRMFKPCPDFIWESQQQRRLSRFSDTPKAILWRPVWHGEAKCCMFSHAWGSLNGKSAWQPIQVVSLSQHNSVTAPMWGWQPRWTNHHYPRWSFVKGPATLTLELCVWIFWPLGTSDISAESLACVCPIDALCIFGIFEVWTKKSHITYCLALKGVRIEYPQRCCCPCDSRVLVSPMWAHST